jgi:hypothetical protein
MVIDHDCRDYIARYRPPVDLSAYSDFLSSNPPPQALVSCVASLDEDKEWETFIVGDMKKKLGRAAEIFIDPSVAG